MNDQSTQPPKEPLSPEEAEKQLAAITQQIGALSQQLKATANASRTSRQVLDTIENNLLVIYKGLDARLQSIEKQVSVLAAPQDKPQ